MSERIWAIFRAPDEQTLNDQIDEALALVGGPFGRPLTGEDIRHLAPVCGHARLCELLHGHDGPHQLGPLTWEGDQ